MIKVSATIVCSSIFAHHILCISSFYICSLYRHGHGIVRPVNGGEWEGTFHMGKCTVGTLRRPNGELEIGRYDSVNPDDVKEGVWWSIDRQTIWIVEDGQKKEQIDEQRAYEIAQSIDVPYPIEDLASPHIEQQADEANSPVKSEE